MVYEKHMLKKSIVSSSNIHTYLCCPKCKQDLEVNEKISCLSCGKQYEIREDIPVLIDLDSLPDHLSSQIKYFEDESISNTEYHLEPWQESYIERFETNFSDVKDKIVIDCGTGSGYMAIELAKQGAFVIACDLTLKSLIRLKRAAQDAGVEHNLLIVCCSAEKLPFKNSIADYFISNAVLEHLPNEKEAIEEINRVCGEKSGIMITVPLAYRYLNPIFLPVNIIHDKRIGHLRRYDEQNILNKFVGYSLIRSYYTGHFGKVVKVLCNFLVHVFDEEKIERDDRKNDRKKWSASNIICFILKS